MKQAKKRLALLLALILLASIPALAEADEFLAPEAEGDVLLTAPVDAAVEEGEEADLWTAEIAAAEAEAADAPEAAEPNYDVLFSKEGVDYRVYKAGLRELAVCGFDPDYTSVWVYQGFTISGDYWKVTRIDDDVFQNKPKLKRVTIVPTKENTDNLIEFNPITFYGSTSLETIDASLYIYEKLLSNPVSGWYDGGNYEIMTYVDSNTGLFGVMVTAYDVHDTSLSIPAEMGGYTVRFLADNLFTQSNVQHVTLPDTLRSIGQWAFCESKIVEADIPEGVVRIGHSAFSYCQSLKTAKIPGTVDEICSQAFMDCPALQRVVVGDGVKTIAGGAFQQSPALHTLVLPSSVTSIQGKWTSVNPNLFVVCADGSYAKTWAEKHGFAAGKQVSIKNCTVTVKDKTYTGKAIKPAPVVMNGSKKLVRGVDYTVSYKNNKAIGTATMTVYGIGKYKYNVKKTFKIKPKPVALNKLSAGTGRLSAKWDKTSGGAGYQLQYSRKKDFSVKKTMTITDNATVKTLIKGLISGKRYYVRIRGYKKVGDKAYYSAWSDALSRIVN